MNRGRAGNTANEVNPFLWNPWYSNAARLCDVKPGAVMVTYHLLSCSPSSTIFTSNWYKGLNDEMQADLLADTQQSTSVSLTRRGLHPPLEGREENAFSVIATKREVRRLADWLEKRGDKQSAADLGRMFPEFFEKGPLGHLWERLMQW